MERLLYRRRWIAPAGRLGRQILLSAGLVTLAVAAAGLPGPLSDTLRYGLRYVLSTDYDLAPAMRSLAHLTGPAEEGDTDRDAPGGTIPVSTVSAPGADASTLALIRPVPPGEVLSWFGWRVGGDGRQEYHTGVDLAAPMGEAVRAAADGRAKAVGDDPSGYGRYVIVSHGGGWETLYAHNSRLLVTPGQQVRRGQAIARVGQTGNATAPHVHLEVRLGGTAVDPAPYLGLARD